MRRASSCIPLRAAAAGVTLVEMIVAIVVTGILVGMASMFGRVQIESYFDVTNRAALADAADTALRRMARDVQTALPNSVRVSGSYLEFVPIRDAGRYRAAQTPAGTGDILDFTTADTSFDILGPSVEVQSGDRLVVYNLGITGANVYVGDVRRDIPAAGVGAARTSIVFTAVAATPLPLASPANRFHVVTQPVTYECDLGAGVLRRYWNYGFASAQGTPPAGGSSAVLVNGVTACAFTYTPGVQSRNGLVVVRLTLSGNGESASLLQQIDVMNSP